VQHLDRRCCRVGQLGVIHAAGGGGSEAEAGAHPGAAGKDGVAHGEVEQRWRRPGVERPFEDSFEMCCASHHLISNDECQLTLSMLTVTPN
jgi:hypothetical protein